MPLPHISGSLPSELKMRMPYVGPLLPLVPLLWGMANITCMIQFSRMLALPKSCSQSARGASEGRDVGGLSEAQGWCEEGRANPVAAHSKISVQDFDGLLWGQDRLFLMPVVNLQCRVCI